MAFLAYHKICFFQYKIDSTKVQKLFHNFIQDYVSTLDEIMKTSD